jgi:hypothetical protein
MKFNLNLKSIDLYGVPFYFSLFNNSLYKSNTGGIMSLLTIISFIVSFLYFSKDFYLRQNPKITFQQEIKSKFQSHNISNDNIFLSLNFLDSNLNSFDYKSYFKVLPIVFNFNFTSVDNFLNLNLIPFKNCSQYNSLSLHMDKDLDFRDNLCFDLNNISLSGYWGEEILSYAQIILNPCKNDINLNITCKSNEEILDKIQKGVFFTLFTNSYYTIPLDQLNPFKISSTLYYGQIDKNIGKSYNFFYKRGTILQDNGLLFQNELEYSLLGIDSVNIDTFSLSELNESTSFVNFNLFSSQKIENFGIIYSKVQETFANIGGILNLIILVFSNIAIVITKYQRNLDIISKIFDFNGFNDDESLKEIISSKMINSQRRNFIKLSLNRRKKKSNLTNENINGNNLKVEFWNNRDSQINQVNDPENFSKDINSNGPIIDNCIESKDKIKKEFDLGRY